MGKKKIEFLDDIWNYSACTAINYKMFRLLIQKIDNKKLEILNFLFKIFFPKNPQNTLIKSLVKPSLVKCTVKYSLEKVMTILTISTARIYKNVKEAEYLKTDYLIDSLRESNVKKK